MQHRSTRDLQPSVRAPDTRTAPTSAYLSNYRYRAYRAYPGDPAGRQSGASITASTFLMEKNSHIRCRPHQRKLRHTFSTYVRMRIERAYRWPCAMTPSAF